MLDPKVFDTVVGEDWLLDDAPPSVCWPTGQMS